MFRGCGNKPKLWVLGTESSNKSTMNCIQRLGTINFNRTHDTTYVFIIFTYILNEELVSKVPLIYLFYTQLVRNILSRNSKHCLFI